MARLLAGLRRDRCVCGAYRERPWALDQSGGERARGADGHGVPRRRGLHGALGGGDDSDPSDDVCPRPASGDDKGCGGKDANGDIGGPIRTDVVVK